MLNRYFLTTIVLVLFSSALFSQHILYFTIPACPSTSQVKVDKECVTTVYPNPSLDYLTISIDKKMMSEINSIDIIDSTGKTIATFIEEVKNSAEGMINLSISEIPDGIYFVL